MSQADQTVSTHRLDRIAGDFALRIVLRETTFLIAGQSTVGREPGVVGRVTSAA